MNENFAAAMRQATEHTRAANLTEATRIIQAALAGRSSGPTSDETKADIVPAATQNARTPFKADPNAEIIEPEAVSTPKPAQPAAADTLSAAPTAARPPRMRMPLADTLRVLRDGKAGFGAPDLSSAFAPLGRQAKVSVDIPAGAAFETRSFACRAGTRTYKLYRPASLSGAPNGLIVMLHGCKQDPDDFAVGTGMNALAEEEGLIVVYPGQTSSHNASSCWNWFRPGDQMRDRGEPAILAGLTQEIAEEFGVDRDRTFIAGLSAGGAMAAIMGETYPDVFAAIGVHSGLAHGSANDIVSAFAAMRGDAGRAPTVARNSAPTTQFVRTIVFQGRADHTVHASNAERIMAMATSRMESQDAQASHGRSSDGRSFERKVVEDGAGRTVAECWMIDGAGHAWSGGDARGSYADPKGPDASREMVRFFLHASR
ncbi:alpha/beta hydrolase family esterase [Georhizobium sp. MAB10]|uniref:extracellular catalytic domain type 1 short-chain-length polyhydroxyalkanoate depolymerase n=1 Tax=Georhizobium sp. MAB10 TaxID=3028319 RepID=UPI003855EC84